MRLATIQPVHIESYPEAEVPIELRVQQVALQDRTWPSDKPTAPSPWHDPGLRPVSMLCVHDDRVVAALDILSKDITHVGTTYSASGLSAVVTDPAYRGRGYGHRIVQAARDVIAASRADLGIFTCDTPLRTFYERAGWRCLEDTVLVGGTADAPYPSDLFDKVTMAEFFSEKARANAEAFIGSRIELYPGQIDKLW
jgi:aminoglycoside 2'-N-acetyltransferase I